ncbi:MAG: DUF2867 domain-containing protein [Thermoleophilaceae bacterium]|nr:DUF2867 domain-containing protein [Thermoleophilaceae bacterium]
MTRVAVIGATGYVGGRLLPALLADERYIVRALARTPQKLSAVAADAPPGRFELASADVDDPASLLEALRDVKIAFYLVHSMGANTEFHEADLRGARNFGSACAEAGVERIVYLSGLGADDDELSDHLRSRHETGDALRKAGVPVTELRAAIIVGSGSASFEIVRDLSKKLPVMVTPRWVRSRCEPIAIRDVVAYLVGVIDEPRSVGQTLEIGGGDQLSYADMMRICGNEQGRKCLIITLPVLTPRLSSYWLHLVTSVDIKLARPLIEGLRNDVICNDTRIREWLPRDLIGYREAVGLALARDRSRSVRESRWTDASAPLREGARRVSRVRIMPSHTHFRDTCFFDVDVSADEAWRRITRIGGDYGYGKTADKLWKLRGAMDRLVGGPGLRRGRPFGTELRRGDALDFWRVDVAQAPQMLELVAEMRVPGQARLAFRVEELPGGGARVHQSASLSNDNVFSGLYWFAVLPLHLLVFERLGRHLLAV